MNQNQTESKPADAEQEIGKGLDETPCSAFGLYRPDGSLFRVILCERLNEGQEDSILASAWKELQPEDDFRSGIPRPEAENAAKASGWRVVPVTILPNNQSEGRRT